MQLIEVVTEAERWRARYVEPERIVPLVDLVGSVLGNDGLVRLPARAMGAAKAMICRWEGATRLCVRVGLTPLTERWEGAHELGHLLLTHSASTRTAEHEVEANVAAAVLLAPSKALRNLASALGDDIESLARLCMMTQTATALRLAEAHRWSAGAVVTPAKVYARAPDEFSWPSEGEIRKAARAGRPGLSRAAITDAPRRVALWAA